MKAPFTALKYKVILILQTTEEARVFLMEAGFTPGDPFPTNEKMRDGMQYFLSLQCSFTILLLID